MPCAPRGWSGLGCTWWMLWAGGFDAGGLMWTRWAFALLSAPPWSPGRGSTGCVQMLPPAHLGTHTPGHPQGWDVSTDLSVWQPGQGCSSSPAVAWYGSPGTVPDLVYPANGRVETLEVK